MKNEFPIYVTQPFLPPLEEFIDSLKIIWENKWLTNNGPFHQQFEKALADYLGVKYISLFSNGTLALITALQTLKITGEVITTPYSFVATTHALWWNGIKPVFVDIEPEYLNIDPKKIESAITSNTTAILPVHVYGNPCQMEKIQKIADTHGLKVIYDACHAFGVKKKDTSILNHGDLSVLSFHATKIFNTFEGGAIVCHDEKTKRRIDDLKNFGFRDEVTVVTPGINAKMNEFQSALGILQLKYLEQNIQKRKKIVERYHANLSTIKGITYLKKEENVSSNYAYFPILITDEYGLTRENVYELFKENNILSRRYFYPLISQFSSYHELPSAKNLSIAEKVSSQILCLPLYPDLKDETIDLICNLLKTKFKSKIL